MGLIWDGATSWTQPFTLPALALAMTLSTTAITGSVFRSPRRLVGPGLSGVVLSYIVLTGVILGLSVMLVHDPDFWVGFVVMAAVPPAVAVVPFTVPLGGNVTYSLLGAMGGYLAALVVAPAITIGIMGAGFVDPWKLFSILLQLVLLPLAVSRVLVWTGVSHRIDHLKGTAINWSFFVVVYTVVGVNRTVFLSDPLSLWPVAMVIGASTFGLAWGIERWGRRMEVAGETLISLMLLGTLKNYGLAAGLCLALFNHKAAVPAAVANVFLIPYVIWLGAKTRGSGRR